MKQLLDAVFQLMGLLLADVLDPGAIMGECGIGHCALQHVIGDAIDLQREKQEVGGGRRDAVLDIAKEFGARGLRHIAGVGQLGEGGEPADQFVDRFELADCRREGHPAVRRLGQCRQPPFVLFLEGDAAQVGAREIALDLRRFDSGIEVGQIPFGQRAQGLIALPGFGAAGEVRAAGRPVRGGMWAYHVVGDAPSIGPTGFMVKAARNSGTARLGDTSHIYSNPTALLQAIKPDRQRWFRGASSEGRALLRIVAGSGAAFGRARVDR